MEAVPRLPMINFEMLNTPEKVSFGPKLKPYIASFYQEDPESYNTEIQNLEKLRASAVWPSVDITSLDIMKKYFCQLHFLKSRFPMEENQDCSVYFSWKDDYTKMSCSLPDINIELMCILYNIGNMHAKLGAEDTRSSPDGMKLSCSHFQCAAWAFQTVRESYMGILGLMFVSFEQMRSMELICLAQAQECILEKSLLDNRKATIIAKIALKLSDYYRQALNAFETSDEGLVFEHLPNHKFIMQYLNFKIAYNRSVALLYQGQQAEEQQKMGERVAFYQAALIALEDARKYSSKMSNTHQALFKDTIAFTLDVIEGKRKAATNENEFIYHEDVPQLESLQEIKGASLVKGIPFNIHDLEVSGPDIFGRLVPMEAHEASSLYSEQKAQMLRGVGERVEKRDQELHEFLSSMQFEVLQQMKTTHILPQDLVDRAAAIMAKPNPTKDLVDVMAKLSDLYQDVEAMLQEIQVVLKEEEDSERSYQEVMGKRPPSIIATDLSREATKYLEAHSKATESNNNLHKAMTGHIANLKLLAQPLSALRVQIPKLQRPDPNIDENIIEKLEILLGKVDEMKNQRMTLWSQLRDNVHNDDITSALVTRQPEQALDALFQHELEKHKKTVALIDQNLTAQDNICRVIVESYAKFTPTRKYLQDFIGKRNSLITTLITSYDTFDDLLAKANKGIEFYTKLETNVSKLLQRIKGGCKVQQEEREQIMIKNGHGVSSSTEMRIEDKPVHNMKPKLKDYLNKKDVIGPQMQYPTSSVYPMQNAQAWSNLNDSYTPQPPSYNTNNHNSQSTSNNYGSYGYTQVNYADKNINQNLVDKMNAVKIASTNGQYDYTNSQAYNYPVSLPAVTNYSYNNTNLHTSVTPQANPANYSNPPSTYQVTSSTNYPYITTSEHYSVDQYPNSTVNTDGVYTSTNTTIPTVDTTMSYYKPNESNYVNYQQGLNYGDNSVDQSYSSYPYNYTSPSTNYGANNVATCQNLSNNSVTSNTYNNSVTPNTYNNYDYNTYSNNQGIYGTPQNATSETNLNTSAYNQQTENNYNNPTYYPYSATTTTTTNPQIYSPAINSQINYQQNYLNSTNPQNMYANYNYPSTSPQPPNYYNYSTGQPDVYNQQTNNVTSTQLPSNTTQLPSTNNQYLPNQAQYQPTNQQLPSTSTNIYQPTNQQLPSTSTNIYQPTNQQLPGTSTNTYQTPYPDPYSSATDPRNVQMYMNTPNAIHPNTPSNTVLPNSSQNTLNTSYSTIQVPVQPASNTSIGSHKKESSIDLLAGLDFTIKQEPLIPQKESKKEDTPLPKIEAKESLPKKAEEKKPEQLPSVPKKKEKFLKKGEPLKNDETLRQFLIEADKFEKYVDALNVKTLNGPSTLDLKWKEIQDCQEHMDVSKRSISVARCYPLKNRSADILPYDYSRVELLDRNNDYINASHIRDFSPFCMDFIVTQNPPAGTVIDFWSMVWEQQVETIVCLLSDNELKTEIYWPLELGKELIFATRSITMLSCANKGSWIERKLNIVCLEQKQNRLITLLQYTTWPGSLFPNNPLEYIQFLNQIIKTYESQICNGNPVLIHCLSGVGRSGICCALLAVLMEFAAISCPLPDIPSLACKISCARKNILRDREHLRFVFVALCNYIQSIKRELVKSDNEKADEEVKVEVTPVDPLSTLDPMWATKKF